MKKIKGNVNIEKIAKDWSLYLTNDLSGALHGFNNISKYLIKDSTIYKDARKWATGVDITFVSKHTLDNPTFTDLKINNFTIYDENAFSCEVYLQKHLTLSSMRSKKINDVFNERMYFVYYEGTNAGYYDGNSWIEMSKYKAEQTIKGECARQGREASEVHGYVR